MISIIIPTAGEILSLQRLCHSIMSQRIQEDYEVLIVANPPNQRLQKLISQLPSKFYYLSSEIRGANAARNVGIKNAKGRYFFFFDSDCELPTAEFLEDSCNFLDKNAQILSRGGPYRSIELLKSEWERAYYFIQCKWLFEGRDLCGGQRYLIGGNMQFRSEIFAKYGLFDENLRFGGTETEFFRRLPSTVVFFDPKHRVLHDYEIGFFGFLKKAFLQGLGRAYIAEIHGDGPLPAIRYGEQALLNYLEMPVLPVKGIKWYSWAFEAGERYYSQYHRTKVPNWIIIRELVLTFLKKKKKEASLIDQWLRIIRNFRRGYDSK